MDPFRDELAATHAKIAALERRIAHLRDSAGSSDRPPISLVERNARILVILCVMLTVALTALFFFSGMDPMGTDAAHEAAAVLRSSRFVVHQIAKIFAR